MINSIPSSASTVAPYMPIGRQPVGLESTELKNSSLKALEQSSDTAPGLNRQSPEYSANQDAERDRVTRGATQDIAQQEQQQQEQQQKEQRLITELATRDRAVRAHEQAHASVGGQHAGSPTYSFQRGPDGVNYAVGGEVAIDTSAVPNDPEATLRKAQIIRAAASAPAEPSPQDRRVAAQAASLENEAHAQIAANNASELEGNLRSAEDEESARKDEAKKQAAEEDELRKEIRKEEDRQRVELERSNQERAAILAKTAQTTFDISRRLVEIGAVKSTPSVGNFINGSV